MRRTAGLAILMILMLLGATRLAGQVYTEGLPRFHINVAAVYAQLETSVRYDFGGGLVGVRVGFENDLGLEEYQFFPAITASYRIGSRHYIVGSFYSLGRSGQKRLSVDLPLPDTTLTIGTDARSYFNTDVLTLGYGYALMQTDRAAIIPYLALYVASWEAGLEISALGLPQLQRTGDYDLTAPLPMIGMAVHASVARRLSVGGSLGLFFLQVGDYGGSIIDLNANLIFRAWPFLSFGVGLATFTVDVRAEASDFRGEIRYRYLGPSISIAGHF